MELCGSCCGGSKILPESYLKEQDPNYFNFLKTYNLTKICYDCFHESYRMYNNDINNFLDWLDENDNRADETDETETERLRKPFNLSEQLLVKDPDRYIDNLCKYVIYLETLMKSDNANIG